MKSPDQIPGPHSDIRHLIGQCFMPAAFINDSEDAIAELEDLIRKYHIGGLCFFHSRTSAATNFEGKKEPLYNAQSKEVLAALIKRYQKASPTPLLIAIDAEWGLAMRVENTPQYPYALTLGAMQDRLDLVEAVGYHIGSDCRNMGIHWNFAPVADSNTNPGNPVIGFRSFGQDINRVTTAAAAFAQGLQNSGVMNCIKHFPGHGDTATDSHLGLPVLSKTTASLIENELVPFKSLIDSGIDGVMIGHLAVPALTDGKKIPASLSPEVIRGLLKNDMGYDGIVVTDALNMRAVTDLFSQPGMVELEAFKAGNDILCFPDSIREGIERIAAEVEEQDIQHRFKRVQEFKNRAFRRDPIADEDPISVDNIFREMARESLSFFQGNHATLNQVLKNGFMGLGIGKDAQVFHDVLQDELQYPCYSFQSAERDQILEAAKDHDYVIVTVIPLKLRPKDRFGISPEAIDFLQALSKKSSVILYLFGNPYALTCWEFTTFKAVILAYQDFPDFQRNAALHFLGKSDARGTIPVRLKNVEND